MFVFIVSASTKSHANEEINTYRYNVTLEKKASNLESVENLIDSIILPVQ